MLKDDNIKLYSTENEDKSSVVERLIGTMKQHMYKYFTANETTKYYVFFNKLVKNIIIQYILLLQWHLLKHVK